MQEASAAPQPGRHPDPLIQKIVSEISEERVADTMRKLESFETRNLLSDPAQTNRGIGAARQWIFDQFKSFSSPGSQFRHASNPQRAAGFEGGGLFAMSSPSAARQKGGTAGRWILVGGHYDTINLKDAAASGTSPKRRRNFPLPA